MMIGIRRPLYLGLIALSILIWSQAAQAAPSSLSAVALRLSELPPGFSQSYGGYVSNEVVARSNHVSPSLIGRLGRLTGYEVNFSRRSGKGACCIWNSVVEFKSASSAAAGYRFYVTRDRKNWRSLRGYGEWTSPDGTLFVYAYPFILQGKHEVEVAVESYRGSYVVTAGMDAVVGTMTPRTMVRDTMRYADIVLGRTQ